MCISVRCCNSYQSYFTGSSIQTNFHTILSGEEILGSDEGEEPNNSGTVRWRGVKHEWREEKWKGLRISDSSVKECREYKGEEQGKV